MQMAKTTAALHELAKARLPFIIGADRSDHGRRVGAASPSSATSCIAEPKALIGFAGPRVIEQTVREKLPEGFQRAEFLLEKGAIDMIVDRRQLRDELARLLAHLHGPAGAGRLTRAESPRRRSTTGSRTSSRCTRRRSRSGSIASRPCGPLGIASTAR